MFKFNLDSQEQKILVSLELGGDTSEDSSDHWDIEDVNDFIRKLGILERDKKIDSQSRQFIQVYEVRCFLILAAANLMLTTFMYTSCVIYTV